MALGQLCTPTSHTIILQLFSQFLYKEHRQFAYEQETSCLQKHSVFSNIQ